MTRLGTRRAARQERSPTVDRASTARGCLGRRTAVCGGILLAALCAGPAPAGASFPGRNGRIAFAGGHDVASDLLTVKATGGRARRLTQTGLDSEPAWSADGKQIAFASTRDIDANIWLMDAVGGTQRRLLFRPGWDEAPAWAPRRRRMIGFTADNDGNFDLATVSPLGTGYRRRTSARTDDRAPTFSPDGKTLAFVRSGKKSDQIYLLKLKDRKLRRLTRKGHNEAPSWSPDGKWLVFARGPWGKRELYRVRANGKATRRLTRSPLDETHPTWSPDGRLIAFVQGRPAEHHLAVIPAAGGIPRAIWSGPLDAQSPDWQPRPRPRRRGGGR